MTTSLVITNKLLSIKGKINVTDISDQLLYEAEGEFSISSPTWRISDRIKQVASARKKVLSFSPTWEIKSDAGDFMIKGATFAFNRTYKVVGGPFDGAKISGNVWDTKFNISNRSQIIAKAAGKTFTLRDRHSIEVIEANSDAELLTVVTMVVLLLEKKSERQQKSLNGRS